MSEDLFKIYVERLREGAEQEIQEVLSPDFLDIREFDLVFEKPVHLRGKAYLAEDELVIHWDIQTEVLIPCSICNEPVVVAIEICNFYYSEPLVEIKSGIYSFKKLLRETILLEVPTFAECQQGKCPKRREYVRYLKEPSDEFPETDEGYQPFIDLDLKP